MSRRSLRIARKVGNVFESNSLTVKTTTAIVEETISNERNVAKRAKKGTELDENGSTDGGTMKVQLVQPSVKQETSSEAKEEKHDALAVGFKREMKYIGAHVSISGGLHLACRRALEIGAKSFALFLRSQRQWVAKPLSEEQAQVFRDACQSSGFSPKVIIPHGIYLMNCGSPDEEILRKSREVLVDELQRCEMLGLTLYNFHPGSTCGKIPVEDCLDRIADSINLAHKKTKYVMTVLENMSCQGNTIGGKFEELRGIIDRVSDKSRVGVCLDTCHAFAAGHNLSTEEGFKNMMNNFENIIGIEYLKAVHLNDSKGELGCHLDRHENIGKGKIGTEAFQRLMKDKRFDGIPMVLETPCQSDDTYEKEIRILYGMCK